jgi:restriction system protein
MELLAIVAGRPAVVLPEEEATAELVADPLSDVHSLAVERIKDLISALDWDEMQELVAGLLRAMGYKTQVSPAGADRGKDILKNLQRAVNSKDVALLASRRGFAAVR